MIPIFLQKKIPTNNEKLNKSNVSVDYLMGIYYTIM